jgi:CheY-like chemotaxis protein
MKKCLIVDDVEVTRFTAAQYLKDLEVETAVVENGQDALVHLARQEMDMVLLDWHLGKESGIDLLTQIRERFGAKPRVIIFSGVESSREATQQAKAAGADEFLEKPTTKEKLAACLQRLGLA